MNRPRTRRTRRWVWGGGGRGSLPPRVWNPPGGCARSQGCTAAAQTSAV